LSDTLKKIISYSDALVKSVRSNVSQAERDQAELKRELDDIKNRLRKLEQPPPSTPAPDLIRKHTYTGDTYEAWLGRAEWRYRPTHEPPSRIQ
jgi:hypothetical protein